MELMKFYMEILHSQLQNFISKYGFSCILNKVAFHIIII